MDLEEGVARLVAAGHDNSIIASELGISIYTVNNLVSGLYSVSGARDGGLLRGRSDASRVALRRWLQTEEFEEYLSGKATPLVRKTYITGSLRCPNCGGKVRKNGHPAGLPHVQRFLCTRPGCGRQCREEIR